MDDQTRPDHDDRQPVPVNDRRLLNLKDSDGRHVFAQVPILIPPDLLAAALAMPVSA